MKQPNTVSAAELSWRETASQTAGPYVHIGLAPEIAGLPSRNEEVWNAMAQPDAEGEHIEIYGTVIDGNGDLVKDALLEAWQANTHGEYDCDYDLHKPFNSFGRTAATVASGGEWLFATVKPGAVKMANGRVMAPHVNLAVFARGINVHLNTRLYFDDEAAANAQCPILNAVESAARRQTLLARREAGAGGKTRYRFDIRLQGERETVFFDF
ncbi:MAG TPA: protocatechuate 3,4-dioxygenase subunit alpha [Salinisphaeraceae bacterium]|nr:protocatechuate 3,4-dioxygenase subunit alpha [Salinisphaeraceae bacterium]